MKARLLIIFFTILLCGMTFTTQTDDFIDISSFANINEINQQTIDLDLNIDFDNKK